MKKLIFDIDMTLTKGKGVIGYEDAIVNQDVVEKLVEYRNNGFSIVLSTSRNMNSYSDNIGKINKNTLPVILKWLEENKIPYDEIYVGKPWCGHFGFYVDDKSIRPSEFLKYSYEEIIELLGNEI